MEERSPGNAFRPFSARFTGGWSRVEPPPPRTDLTPTLFPSPPLPGPLADLKRWWQAHPVPADAPREPGRLARDFLRQAQLMADFEDDFDAVAPFHRYWPTYRDMDDAQLRTYFTFRTKVRRGEFPAVPLSYLFVLAYELLARVGVAKPADALALLTALETHYAPRHAAAGEHLSRWRRDFVVACNLSSEAANVFAEETLRDRDLVLLAKAAETGDGELFGAICRVAAFDAERSAGARAAGKRFSSVACRTVRLLAKHPAFFFSSCLRLRARCDRWQLFAGALFRERAPQPDHVFSIDPVRRFRFEAGECFYQRFPGGTPSSGRAVPLNHVLHECDRQVRLAWHLPGRLKERTLPPGAAQAIARAVEEERLAEAAAERESRKIAIDFAKLARIRRDAEATRDALLEGGEAEELKSSEIDVFGSPEKTLPPPVAPAVETPAPAPPVVSTPLPAAAPGQAASASLPAPYRAFLAAVLAGTDWKACARAAGQPAEVLADAINARALDETGDILLEAGDDGPRVIEGYEDLARRLAGLSES